MIGWDTDIDSGRWQRRTRYMGLGTGYHIDLIFLHIDRFHSGRQPDVGSAMYVAFKICLLFPFCSYLPSLHVPSIEEHAAHPFPHHHLPPPPLLPRSSTHHLPPTIPPSSPTHVFLPPTSPPHSNLHIAQAIGRDRHSSSGALEDWLTR